MQNVAAHYVGPNAIIQTLASVGSLTGTENVAPIMRRAFLLEPLDGWDEMVPVEQVNGLNKAVLDTLGADQAATILHESGRRTGRYIIENRIPPLIKRLLGSLPRRLASRLLLQAIRKNAWTFAGKARVESGGNWICIHENPLCLGRTGYGGCVWHESVFQTLFQRIVGSEVHVHETRCMGRGDAYCRFELSFG
ncbi:MAG: bacteriochlorophyll 4-vinyl reductase [Pseudomonadota bacterium]